MIKFPFLLVLLATMISAGCSGVKEKATSISEGTVNEIYVEASAFALKEFPASVLIAFTSHDANIDRINWIPDQRDITGSLNHWSYIFVKSIDLLDDGIVNESDVFSIEFSNSKMTLAEYAVVRDWNVEEDDIYGDDILIFDSDYIFEKIQFDLKESYGETPIRHINYNCMMGNNEVSYFISEEEGYSGQFDIESGEFSYLSSFSIVTY